MEQFTGLIGIVVLLGIAFALSNNRKKINLRILGWGLGLQMIFAIFILKLPFGGILFGYLDKAVRKLISFSDAGSDFLFKSFIPDVGYHVAMINFAFRALPTIIFFSSLMAVLYHYGIIQVIVKWIARAMQKTMGTSGSETLSISANIFVGQTEAPLMVRPFISKMTQSELTAVMTGGFATVAGGILAIYVMWLGDIPGIAGHLLAASVMSAPAALVMAKIIYPETEISETMGDMKFDIEQQKTNVFEALGDGASTGLKLAANVGAMLIAFVSLVAMINYLLSFVGISMDGVLGFIFKPLAWTMGVPWEEAGTLGMLMGEKIVFTELIAYGDLKELIASDAISDRTAIIASYALCGFANFSSVGILLSGMSAMVPERRKDLIAVSVKALWAALLASCMTGFIVGILYL